MRNKWLLFKAGINGDPVGFIAGFPTVFISICAQRLGWIYFGLDLSPTCVSRTLLHSASRFIRRCLHHQQHDHQLYYHCHHHQHYLPPSTPPKSTSLLAQSLTSCFDCQGVRLFARRTFTTPKIRTFPTPKFGHFPPPKKNFCQEDSCHPQFFFFSFFFFFGAFFWLFRLTAHGGHQGWEGGGA